MKRVACVALGVALLGYGLAAEQGQRQREASGAVQAQPPPAPATPSPRPSSAPVPSHQPASSKSQVPAAEPVASAALVKQYCATCHSERGKAGGLSLAAFDPATSTDIAVSEKMIRKLRAGMMPPAGAKRPEEARLKALAESLEARIDREAAVAPNPGWRPSQRLNRAEYAHAVRDLLDIDVDVSAYLPADTISDGFDNVADVQRFSSTLMEGYLRAASQISRLAVGDRQASASSVTYKVPRTSSQMRQVEGAPIGTRGGISLVHIFPADGDYVFKLLLHGGPTGQLFGGPRPGEQVEVSINGARVVLLDINPRMDEADPQGLNLETPVIHVKAGPQRVTAAFVARFDAPVDDLMMPVEHTLADTNIGEVFGTTALPHLRDFTIRGPQIVTGISDTPSRRRIFTCRPTSAAEEASCAADIVRRLASHAYRGPATARELDGLMTFYDRGRTAGGFEPGIRLALQAILASPRFILRLESAPATVAEGQTYRIAADDLASRLSFFLWGTAPDEELVSLAAKGTLTTPAVLDRQVRRMLADPRSEALATRFASQWLRLQDADQVRPDHHFFPHWDQSLTKAFRRETELFFDSLVREDRSLLDLLTADYSFVNERIARHYGIPNVVGNQFRRVTLPETRRGILGHGSILLLTSTADRTSPVQRGKWVMEVLLGSPPPPPPPNVPDLEEVSSGGAVRQLTVRERMEEHRKNPACTSCHRVIDPLGLALENYDVTGKWRINDNGIPVDVVGDLYDGTRMEGPAGLRAALLKHKDVMLLSFTESLMTYAVGRRVEYFDMPAVRRIVRDAAARNYKLSSFVLGVVNSPAFKMSKVGAVETEAGQ